MRVVAGDSQTGMPNLIFHEVAGHHARLHVAHSTMSEGVHPTGFDVDFFRRAEKESFCKYLGSQAECQPLTERVCLSDGPQGSHEAVEW